MFLGKMVDLISELVGGGGWIIYGVLGVWIRWDEQMNMTYLWLSNTHALYSMDSQLPVLNQPCNEP